MSGRLTTDQLTEIRNEVDPTHLFIEEPACYHCAVHGLLAHIDTQQAEIERLTALATELAEALDGVLADIGTTTEGDEALLAEARAAGVIQ